MSSPPTWPRSGMTCGGRAYELPTSELPIGATGGSLLPTPLETDSHGHCSRGGDRSGEMFLPGVVKALLPTPVVTDSRGARNRTSGRSNPDSNHHDGVTLNDAIRLLPTPDAAVFNDGQSVEAWRDRHERELEKGYNGNGGGTPLAMAVRLLPTPRASDGPKGGPNQTGDSLQPTIRALLPTPTARDHKDTGDLSGVPENSLLPRVIDRLLPTPTARLGDQRGAQSKRYTNPDRSNDLDDAIKWLGESSSPPSGAGNDSPA
jgi:hypothetical protein